MGAFGVLLNSYFGGTKHDVNTWSKEILPKKTRIGKVKKLYNEQSAIFKKLSFEERRTIYKHHPYSFMPSYHAWKNHYRNTKL